MVTTKAIINNQKQKMHNQKHN